MLDSYCELSVSTSPGRGLDALHRFHRLAADHHVKDPAPAEVTAASLSPMRRFLLNRETGQPVDASEPPQEAGAESAASPMDLSRRASTVSHAELDPNERSDADLEASVLDTLTDTVLTGHC